MLLCSTVTFAQVEQPGQVLIYNGKGKANTILNKSVEIHVNGAGIVTSDKETGKFKLKFPDSKIGSRLQFQDLPRSMGYVLMNTQSLRYWNISPQNVFPILFCTRAQYDALVQQYYDIGYNSYKQQLQEAETKLRKSVHSEMAYQDSLKVLKEKYETALARLETAAMDFACLDLNELDNNSQRALALLSEGKIDEALQIYQDMNLEEEVKLQIQKHTKGGELISKGSDMQAESLKDLHLLVDKLDQQISACNIGGQKYYRIQLKALDQILCCYDILRKSEEQDYDTKYAGYLYQKGILQTDINNRIRILKEAASLNHYESWVTLGEIYEQLVFDKRNSLYLDSLKLCYQKACEITPPNDTIQKALKHVNCLYDFHQKNKEGVDIYYKIYGTEAHIIMRCANCSNIVDSPVLSIPEAVVNEGKTYRVTAIEPYAFAYNKTVRKVITGNQFLEIHKDAFELCPNLDTICINCDSTFIYNSSLPEEPLIILAQNPSEELIQDLIFQLNLISDYLVYERYESAVEKHVRRNMAYCDYIEKNEINMSRKDSISYLNSIATLCLYNDNVDCARKYYDQLWREFHDKDALIGKAKCYIKEEKYDFAINTLEMAFPLSELQYENYLQFINQAAYFNARKRNFSKAHQLIDIAITSASKDKRFSNSLANLIDSKGEFYIMADDWSNAQKCRDTVLQVNPKFKEENPESELFSSVGGDRDIRSQLKRYVEIIQQTEKEIYNKYGSFENGYRGFCYEELVSIGIVVVHAFIKDKDVEQYSRYDDTFISKLVKYATLMEIKYRKKAYCSDFEMELLRSCFKAFNSPDFLMQLSSKQPEQSGMDNCIVLRINKWDYSKGIEFLFDEIEKIIDNQDYNIEEIVVIPVTSQQLGDTINLKNIRLDQYEINFIIDMSLKVRILNSTMAYTLTCIEGDTPAQKQGMSGEYIVLKFDDWTIQGKMSLINKNVELRGKPKTIVVMKDGVISKHFFEDKIGVQISCKYVGKEEKQRIIEVYEKWEKIRSAEK